MSPRILKHDGGDCPVDAETVVRVKWRNGQTAMRDYPAGKLRWLAWPDGESPWDIVRWRLAM